MVHEKGKILVLPNDFFFDVMRSPFHDGDSSVDSDDRSLSWLLFLSQRAQEKMRRIALNSNSTADQDQVNCVHHLLRMLSFVSINNSMITSLAP